MPTRVHLPAASPSSDTEAQTPPSLLRNFLTNPKETYTVTEVAQLLEVRNEAEFTKHLAFLAKRGEIEARPKRAPRELPYTAALKLIDDEGRCFIDRIAQVVAEYPTDMFVVPGTVLIDWVRSLLMFHEQSHCQHDMVDGANKNRYCRKCFANDEPHPQGEHAYIDEEQSGLGNRYGVKVARKVCISCLHVTAPHPNVDYRNEAKTVAEIQRTATRALQLAHETIQDAVRYGVSTAERQRLHDSFRRREKA